MRTAVLVALALAILAGASAVWAQGGPPPGGPGGPGKASLTAALMPPKADMIDCLTKTLSLTTDQATALKAVLTASDTALDPLIATAADKAKAVRTAIFAETYVDDDVALARSEAEAAEAAVVDQCIASWKSIREVLTADQIATLQAGPIGPPPGGPPPAGSGSTTAGSSGSAARRR